MKRITALVLSILMLCALAACTGENGHNGESEHEEVSLTLPWNSAEGFDMINLSNDFNYAVSRLVFDPLFEVDDSYRPIPVLAESVTYLGTAVIVALKHDVHFHGGSLFTAQDVKYTAEQHMKNPSSPYSKKLAAVQEIIVESNYSVRFVLDAPNRLFAANLDFPIVKSGASGTAYDGTGRYAYRKSAGVEYLLKSEKYFDAENTAVDKITLVPTTENNLVSLFNNGRLDVIPQSANIFDTSIKQYTRAGTFVTNRLTYLVVNPSSTVMASADMRRFVSYTISRTRIFDSFSATKAYTTYSAINPKWYLFDASAVRADVIDPEPAEVTVLVNSSSYEQMIMANGIKSELSAHGISVNVKSASKDEYETAAKSNNYDLRFESQKLPLDADITEILSGTRMFDEKTEYLITEMKSAQSEAELRRAASLLIKALDSEMPIIPLYFTTVEFISSGEANVVLAPTATSPLHGIWLKKELK